MAEPTPTRKDLTRCLLLVTTFISVAIITYVRLRLLNVPLERDEGEYAYIGQLILQGVPPYKLAYTLKLPGVPATYALIMAVFGETTEAIRLGLLLVNLTTIALLFFLVRRLFDDVAASVSASSYAILSLSPSVLGMFAHATHFVVFWTIAGALIIFTAIEKKRSWQFFLAGVLFGFAFIMKQHGIFFVLLGAAWLVFETRRQGIGVKKIAASSAWYALGAVLPFVMICAYYFLAGGFRNFWFWTFDYARYYVSEVPLALGIMRFTYTLGNIVGATLPVWFFALLGLTTPLWDEKSRERAGIMGMFAVFSFLAICPGYYFREHYFVLILPVISLFAGVALSAAKRKQDQRGAVGVAAKAVVYIFIAALIIPILLGRSLYFETEPSEVSREIYGLNPFPEAVEIASRIKASSTPDDRVAVLGSEPEIFFYSGRHSATGHIYMYGMGENQPYAHLMQMEAIKEIDVSRPKFIVFVVIDSSWMLQATSDTTIIKWGQEYVEKHYDRIGVVIISSKEKTDYIWGKEAASFQPRLPNFILLFQRKAELRSNMGS